MYMYFPTKYERETQMYINDIYRGNYFLYENYSIEYLGTYKKGDEFRVKLKLLDDAVYFTNAWFYYIDGSALERFSTAMQKMNASTTLERTGGSRLELEVDADKDCALFTSIPLEEGWTVTVDGVQVEPQGCLYDTLLCVPVTAGKHRIVLDFLPAGLKAGLILTGAGVLGLAAMIAVCRLLRRQDEKMRTLAEQRAQEDNGADNQDIE